MSDSGRQAELRPVPKRLGIGVNVLLQLSLAVLLFVGLNYLSYRYYWRRDLSPNQEHTLSQQTITYLRKLGKEVSLTVVLPRDSKVYESARSLVEEYRRNGKKLVRVEFVDPVRDIERAEQLKIEAGITLARPGILLQGAGRTRLIAEEEIVLEVKGSGENRQSAVFFRGEDAITSGMVSLLEGTVRKFYLVTGKGAAAGGSSEALLASLQELGRQQSFESAPLNLGEVSEIPGDASGLIIAGIKYDLSDREMQMVRAYFNAKRSSLLLMLDPNGETPRLDAFVNSYGVAPRGDRVLFAESTGAGPQKRFEAQGLFSRDTVITLPLADSEIVLAGQTQSLELRPEDPALAEQSVVVKPLIAAAERFWGERQFLDPLPIAGEGDTVAPVHLAAAVERGAAADQRVRTDSSRMVVVGNASLLDRQTSLAISRDFVAASLNWMLNRERLIGITPKLRNSYRIQLSARQHEIIFATTVLAMPGLVLLLGLLVWASRRSA